MVAWQSLAPKKLKELKKLVKAGLSERGIRASIELDPSNALGRYRLYAISKDFISLSEAERQDIIWRVLKDCWSREDQLRITLSLALTDKEAQGMWS